jgi:hypothetical protein
MNRNMLSHVIGLLLILTATAVMGQSTVRVPARTGRTAVIPQARPKPPEDPSNIKVARLHYGGGGDWYWGNSAVPNFLKYVRDNSDFPVDTVEKQVTIMDPDLFRYPFLFATGHGVISFSGEERERLRLYLANGGFLFVNDSYGVAQTFKQEMAELFPEREVVELPFDHPLYHAFHDFPNGPPKIHEHDKKPPRGYGIIIDGRVVLYFLVESDIGDGWEDSQVHNDPPEKRDQALRMGLNILSYALLY